MRGAFVLVSLVSSLSLVPLARAQTEAELVDPALEAPAPPPPWAGLHEEAQALDARADHARAADAYERYARACLASRTAVLTETPSCGATAAALTRAFTLRQALGQLGRADADAADYLAHFLYAHPRAAIRIGYARARMHLGAGQLDRAEAALAELEGALPDAPPGLVIVADVLRARVATRRGRAARASVLLRRVERRFEREQSEIEASEAIAASTVREAVAEGRLVRAEAAVARFLAIRGPRPAHAADARAWFSETMSPWLVRSRRRLLLARMALERVYELGSPRHSVIAAARIGELYAHQAELHAALRLPESEWIQVMVNDGRDRPGYDDARAHLETCVAWAAHHGVAADWARRCEERLHRLDPYRYPLTAELHGRAVYSPTSRAEPRPLGVE